MVRLKHRLTEAPHPPERGVKAATFHLLLDTAMELIRQQGRVPSIAEVAVRSNVSRATTYRYFPSRSALVTAVVGASLGPVRAFASSEPDGRALRASTDDLMAELATLVDDLRDRYPARWTPG